MYKIVTFSEFHKVYKVVQLEKNGMSLSCGISFSCTTRYYLSEDKLSGFSLTIEDDIQSLFSMNYMGSNTVSAALLRGGITLNVFDGYLVGFYQSFGFIIVGRSPNWIVGEPEVVFMQHMTS